MIKNKYSFLRNVAFVALMCASSGSYGMDENDAQNSKHTTKVKLNLEQFNQKEKRNAKKNAITQLKCDRRVIESNSEKAIALNHFAIEDARDEREQKHFMNEMARKEQELKMKEKELQLAAQEMQLTEKKFMLAVSQKASTVELQNREIDKAHHLMNREMERQIMEAGFLQNALRSTLVGRKTGVDMHAAANAHRDILPSK
jgi:hypothetical protein